MTILNKCPVLRHRINVELKKHLEINSSCLLNFLELVFVSFLRSPRQTSQLQEEPSTHPKQHPTLFYQCSGSGSVCFWASWISSQIRNLFVRIRICFRICTKMSRIRNTAFYKHEISELFCESHWHGQNLIPKLHLDLTTSLTSDLKHWTSC
jgi:hypothetical protein